MIVAIPFLGFVGLAALVALGDWRRGWILTVLVGVLQDPVRKMTPGHSFLISAACIAVYAVIVFAHQEKLQSAMADFARRFANVWSLLGLVLLALFVAAMNGIVNFGVTEWKGPALSLLIYLAPLPAVFIGYLYVDSEKRLDDFLRFYSVLTSVVLVGSLLEYSRVNLSALGMVSQTGDYIRHLPGIQIRMITGFYRAPDIMAWHAATLTSIAIGAVVRAGVSKRSWPWMFAAAWGFYNCMISGRRKAVYYVAAFAIVFLWRYFRSLTVTQFFALAGTALAITWVIHDMQSNEQASVYAKGAVATRAEFMQRFEGGLVGTIQEVGFLGTGLGSATQGVYHVVSRGPSGGWQEGGLGKLAVEVGVPGLLAFAFLGFTSLLVMLKISGHPDIPGNAQVVRVTLFALVLANAANFLASAQTYSDPLVVLMAAFFGGCTFASATLDERVHDGAMHPGAAPIPAGA